MRKLQWVGTVGTLAIALSVAWAQDEPVAPGSVPPQQPVPAYGQSGEVTPMAENPPLSGLDQPGVEPHAAPLSYLQPGGTVSESADSNVENGLGSGQSVRSITRGIGSMTLQRVWSHYDLAMQYEGGAAYYNQKGVGWKLLQQMDAEQKIKWKRGQFSVRDSFSYLPEGNFGAAYGSMGSQTIGSLGETAFGTFAGGANLGSLGLVPRILNVSIAEVQESLSPKSSITAAGGYAFNHFYGTDPVTGITYLNNTQVSGQVGYNRILTSHTQIALVYGYQGFDFNSVGTSFHSNVVQGMYGRRISGRMDLLLGAGPQLTNIGLPCSIVDVIEGNPHCHSTGLLTAGGQIPDFRVGVAAQARLRYKFPRTSVDLTYERFETSGSGFFAGAQTDLARVRLERPLSRVWDAFMDLGYSRNSRLASLTTAQTNTCVPSNATSNPNDLPVCPGVNARNYTYGFVGLGVHRSFGRNFHGFLSYQFNELAFDNSYCGGLGVCNRIGNRNVVTVGLDWIPRPIRLD